MVLFLINEFQKTSFFLMISTRARSVEYIINLIRCFDWLCGIHPFRQIRIHVWSFPIFMAGSFGAFRETSFTKKKLRFRMRRFRNRPNTWPNHTFVYVFFTNFFSEPGPDQNGHTSTLWSSHQVLIPNAPVTTLINTFPVRQNLRKVFFS